MFCLPAYPKRHTTHKLLSICLLCLIGFEKIRAQPATVAALDKMMAFAEANQCFNGVLLVAEKGKVLYHKGFGYANYETKTPVTETTLFNLASIAKQFTAMGIMMLREQGKLGYDDSLSKYFPRLPYKGVTLRHMLHHTSGLPDYLSLLADQWPESRMPVNADAIAFLEKHKPPAKFKPGERHEYCNTGYMLLASVIEQVSGVSFDQFLQKYVLKPAGMQNTRVYLPGIHAPIPGLATPYAFDHATGTFVPTNQYPPYQRQVSTLEGVYGDGGIFSCSADLIKWDRALKTEKLIKKQTLNEAYTNGLLADGKPIGPVGYGFGWFLPNDPAQGKIVQHTGGWAGSRQAFIRYLDKDRTILVLRNNEVAFGSIQKAVEGILDGKKDWEMPKTTLAFVLALAAQGDAGDVRKKFEATKNNALANEMEINDLGYKLMERDKLKQALEIMKINVELFPNSSNAYDSLGELYLKNGDKAQSESNYKKSKDLLPKNESETAGLAPYGPVSGHILVANKTANTVSVIRLSDYQTLAVVPVGVGPHELAVNPSGTLAAVANYGNQQTVGNSLSIIDIGKREKTKDIPLGEYKRPHGIEFINENEVLVTSETNKALIKVDIQTGVVGEVAKTDQLASHMVAYASADQKAYVANIASGTVSVIDVRGNKLIRQIEFKKGIEGLAVSPDGTELWVANRDDATVTAVDTRTQAVLAVLPAGQVAYRVKFLPNGRYAMVSNGLSGNMSVYDVQKKTRLPDVDFTKTPGTQPIPVGMTAHPNSEWVYVSTSQYDQVAVVGTKDWKVTGRLAVGEGPDGIYFAPAADAGPVPGSALAGLVEAEKAFAQYAKDHSTKAAFLEFLATDGLIFKAGAVKGREFWSGMPEGNDLLGWRPFFADLSASGDLGYTTGPYEQFRDREDAQAAGFGHYVSVWKKQRDGAWKVALDIGIGHPPAPAEPFAISRIQAPAVSGAANGPAAAESLMQAERAFVETQKNKGLPAYTEVLSKEGRIYRPQVAPMTNSGDIQAFIASTDKKFSFVPVESAAAASGDLGYVYGTGIVEIAGGGSVRTLNTNYLRIWKKEDGKTWKIVLDLVNVAR
jgi:YVTN family beta-propeller protein